LGAGRRPASPFQRAVCVVLGSWACFVQLSMTVPSFRLTTSIRTSVGWLLENMKVACGFFLP
jgi:hypothetical protein